MLCGGLGGAVVAGLLGAALMVSMGHYWGPAPFDVAAVFTSVMAAIGGLWGLTLASLLGRD